MSKSVNPTSRVPTAPAKEQPKPVLSIIKDIQRQTRKQYSAEEKIRIVLEGLQGQASLAEICRREGINPNIYYRWSKEFLEAGKKRLLGDSIREATAVNQFRFTWSASHENRKWSRTCYECASAPKQLVAELSLENRLLKKSLKAQQ